jgi:hypothetical protein
MPEVSTMTPFVPLLNALLALLVSAAVAFWGLRYTETTIRYGARNQYMNAVFDIDRQMVNHPGLWAIYDGHDVAKGRDTSPIESGRRQAFMYFHFNLFETVFNDYHRVLRWLPRDEQHWQSWHNWIRGFFRASSDARAEFLRAADAGIFIQDFIQYARPIVDELEKASQSSSLNHLGKVERLREAGLPAAE